MLFHGSNFTLRATPFSGTWELHPGRGLHSASARQDSRGRKWHSHLRLCASPDAAKFTHRTYLFTGRCAGIPPDKHGPDTSGMYRVCRHGVRAESDTIGSARGQYCGSSPVHQRRLPAFRPHRVILRGRTATGGSHRRDSHGKTALMRIVHPNPGISHA